MADVCESCGRRVRVGGGTDTLWEFHDGPDAMTLELVDGTEHFLCFECIEALPEDREVTAEDVAALDRDVED